MQGTCINRDQSDTRKNARKHGLMIEMSERGKGLLENAEYQEGLKRLFLGIMEGYNDAVIPPLSYFSPSPPESLNYGDNSTNSRKKHKSDSEGLHKERRRREQMSENFSLLQSMVPSSGKVYKLCKERILDDTVNYIKHLQEETERLEGLVRYQRKFQKMGMPILTKITNHSSVNVTVSNSATFLAVQLPFRRGSVLHILKVLEKHQVEVLESRIDVNEEKVLTFTATVRLVSDGGSTIDMVRQEILTSLDFIY